MKKSHVALIAYCKTKRDTAVAVPAHQLYQGQLFQAQLAYARNCLQIPDERIFVLSAKYGLVAIREAIEPYEYTLSEKPAKERVWWGGSVVKNLKDYYQLRPYDCHVVMMAGKVYQQPMVFYLNHFGYQWYVSHPDGLGYAQQVAWYREEMKCQT